ncbi:Serine/threonine-protein kinase PAK 1, partial [Lamprotornis superbus]
MPEGRRGGQRFLSEQDALTRSQLLKQRWSIRECGQFLISFLLEVEVLASHLPAREDFQQMTGNEEPQGWRDARELSQLEMLQNFTGSSIEPAAAAAVAVSSEGAFAPPPEEWSPGTAWLMASADRAAAQQQEIEDDFPVLQRTMVNMENPMTQYVEVEFIGNRLPPSRLFSWWPAIPITSDHILITSGSPEVALETDKGVGDRGRLEKERWDRGLGLALALALLMEWKEDGQCSDLESPLPSQRQEPRSLLSDIALLRSHFILLPPGTLPSATTDTVLPISHSSPCCQSLACSKNKNPNVVNYLEKRWVGRDYLVDKQFWLVMQYMDGGTLRDAINETHMSEKEIAAVSREVRDPTLDFLHSNLVIYQDVKSCNTLLRSNSSVELDQYIFSQGQHSKHVGCGTALSDCQLLKNGVSGSAGAPAVNSDFGLSAKLTPEQSRWSSWTYGLGGIEMVEQEVPYWNQTPVSPQLPIATGGRPKLQQPKLFSPLLRDFLSCCLQTDEARRWSAPA